jgi:hypothetical protein
MHLLTSFPLPRFHALTKPVEQFWGERSNVQMKAYLWLAEPLPRLATIDKLCGVGMWLQRRKIRGTKTRGCTKAWHIGANLPPPSQEGGHYAKGKITCLFLKYCIDEMELKASSQTEA